jgi:hypothetical protein
LHTPARLSERIIRHIVALFHWATAPCWRGEPELNRHLDDSRLLAGDLEFGSGY